MKSIDSIIILSGGLDSTTLLYHIVNKGNQPFAISFDYGQNHTIELDMAKWHTEALGIPHQTIKLDSLTEQLFSSSSLVGGKEVPHVTEIMGDPQPTTYVPNRNMLFLAIAAAFAENHGVTDIFYGAQKHDIYGYWDTTFDFLNRINTVFSLNRKNTIKIKAPFIDYTKSDVVRLGTELNVRYDKTWSCYRGKNNKACGVCGTCAERLKAFDDNKILDPLDYEAT